MGFWSGFLVGSFLGGLMGIFTMALCVVAKNDDSMEDKNCE